MRFLSAILLILVPAKLAFGQAAAPPPEPPPRLEASAQLTFLDTRGNSTSQSLGAGDPDWPLHPHIGEDALSVPVRFLLCSDGLTDTLDDEEIADCLALPDGEAVVQLFDHAMRVGGTDNVSIVLVRVEEGV